MAHTFSAGGDCPRATDKRRTGDTGALLARARGWLHHLVSQRMPLRVSPAGAKSHRTVAGLAGVRPIQGRACASRRWCRVPRWRRHLCRTWSAKARLLSPRPPTRDVYPQSPALSPEAWKRVHWEGWTRPSWGCQGGFFERQRSVYEWCSYVLTQRMPRSQDGPGVLSVDTQHSTVLR